ncbi:MAG TPA: hypothetical protein VGO46_18910, partial [Gemmatimonadaceae bacterium]|nr:hypothetical protein [Gemmatimonadaceae bacterium]
GLEIIESSSGLNLARTIDKLALLQSLQLRTSAAIATAERSSAMFTTLMGDDHPETLNSLSLLASYRANGGDAKGAETGARATYAALQKKLGDRHDYTLAAGQRLAWIELQVGARDSARALDASLLDRVREKFTRVPPAYARLLAIDAALKAATASDSAAAEFQNALDLLKAGTRIDSAALPGIVVRYASTLRARGNNAEAVALLQRTISWLPVGADSGSAVTGELRSELQQLRSSDRARRTPHPV